MPKHENNALQKKFYNRFKKGALWGTLDMSMGYTWPVKKSWVACIA